VSAVPEPAGLVRVVEEGEGGGDIEAERRLTPPHALERQPTVHAPVVGLTVVEGPNAGIYARTRALGLVAESDLAHVRQPWVARAGLRAQRVQQAQRRDTQAETLGRLEQRERLRGERPADDDGPGIEVRLAEPGERLAHHHDAHALAAEHQLLRVEHDVVRERRIELRVPLHPADAVERGQGRRVRPHVGLAPEDGAARAAHCRGADRGLDVQRDRRRRLEDDLRPARRGGERHERERHREDSPPGRGHHRESLQIRDGSTHTDQPCRNRRSSPSTNGTLASW